MKIMDKRILDSEQKQNVETEMNICARLQHNDIVSLLFSAFSGTIIYMGYNYAENGDLFTHTAVLLLINVFAKNK